MSKLLNAAGRPTPPTDAEAKASADRVQNLFAAVSACFAGSPPADIPLIALNLAVRWIWSGGPQQVDPRLEFFMQNFTGAMRQQESTIADAMAIQRGLNNATLQ